MRQTWKLDPPRTIDWRLYDQYAPPEQKDWRLGNDPLYVNYIKITDRSGYPTIFPLPTNVTVEAKVVG